MSYITPKELHTHLYGEQIEAISRYDETLVIAAIDAAAIEAKGYLASYDTDKVFSAQREERNSLLVIFVKDIAVWHFINLCNAGTDIELRKNRYERAISWLKAVQKGDVSPDLPAISKEEGSIGASPISFGSNRKRTQHF